MKYSVQRMRVVVLLFVVVGAAAWIQFFITYMTAGLLVPGVEMILLPAGVGLYKRNEHWRKVSIGLMAAGMVAVISVPLLGYTVSPVMIVRLYGHVMDPGSIEAILFVVVYALALLACMTWITFALCNREIRELFSDS